MKENDFEKMAYKNASMKLEQSYWEPIDKGLLDQYFLLWEKLKFVYHI